MPLIQELVRCFLLAVTRHRSQGLDLKEYLTSSNDRTGQAPVLNYGNRKQIENGSESPQERPLSREVLLDGRKKNVNPVKDPESVFMINPYKCRPPSNIAYATSSRPQSEQQMHRLDDKSAYGFGIPNSIPQDEQAQFYAEALRPKTPVWQHLKPPTAPLYKKPETKSRQREDGQYRGSSVTPCIRAFLC